MSRSPGSTSCGCGQLRDYHFCTICKQPYPRDNKVGLTGNGATSRRYLIPGIQRGHAYKLSCVAFYRSCIQTDIIAHLSGGARCRLGRVLRRSATRVSKDVVRRERRRGVPEPFGACAGRRLGRSCCCFACRLAVMAR